MRAAYKPSDADKAGARCFYEKSKLYSSKIFR